MRNPRWYAARMAAATTPWSAVLKLAVLVLDGSPSSAVTSLGVRFRSGDEMT
jgi:hypothetical protein